MKYEGNSQPRGGPEWIEWDSLKGGYWGRGFCRAREKMWVPVTFLKSLFGGGGEWGGERREAHPVYVPSWLFLTCSPPLTFFLHMLTIYL